ncbi:hypothetical protein ACFXD5_24915 [Streptomyces sp. NPDC059385]
MHLRHGATHNVLAC